MMKFIFMFLFLLPMCLNKKMFWMVQNILFLFSFLFILFNYSNYFVNISYFLGYDLISYGLILLKFWICFLMMMASSSVYNYSFYSNLFVFNLVI